MRHRTGIPAFDIVGLPDKAVSEARERVHAPLSAMSIALALLAALEIIPMDDAAQTVALGELSLNGDCTRAWGTAHRNGRSR